MIHDSLGRSAERYYALHPLFRQAFEYIDSHLDELADTNSDGKYAIQGEDLFVMVGSHTLRRAEEAVLEAHDRYIDLQVMIAGSESFGWAQRAACTEPRGTFDTASDIGFYNDSPTSLVTALAGEFVIFFPEDAHAPLIRPEGVAGGSRKAIVKIRVDAK